VWVGLVLENLKDLVTLASGKKARYC
jgi:hypothetical protein